ncbi:hypothetical protein MCON_1979 [Methanothrix soehngenii GP6]|uniref:SWIM-type domain-containing protein n=2 Tax=Methanotrichaceae TaxID=143067 RepID=F4BWQ9_METSG|nr:hypothetical protein MCON_1979 [Methanothrix soehngenii GP6]
MVNQMVEKTLLASGSPITQRIDAVKALLAWKKVSCDPLPEFVEMGDGDSRLVLVLSNKKDAYYTVTAKGCSCPAATYHHGPCKHQKKYFPQEANLRDGLPGWPGGAHGPVEVI